MTITIEQIHQAANQLVEQGINPTQMAVRKQLGGGSFSTIGEGLKSWRVMQDTNAQLAQVAIPTAIGERAELLVAQLWDTAQSLTNEYLNKERESLDHEKSLIRAELEEMRGMVATFEEEQEKTKALLADCTTQKEQLQLELTKIRTEWAGLQDKLKDKEKHNQALTKQIDKLTNENKTLVAETTRLASQQQFKQDEIHRLIAKLDEQTQQQQANDEIQAERLETVKTELSKAIQECALFKGRNQALMEQLNKAEDGNKALLDKVEQLTAKIAQLKASTPKARTRSKANAKDELSGSLL